MVQTLLAHLRDALWGVHVVGGVHVDGEIGNSCSDISADTWAATPTDIDVGVALLGADGRAQLAAVLGVEPDALRRHGALARSASRPRRGQEASNPMTDTATAFSAGDRVKVSEAASVTGRTGLAAGSPSTYRGQSGTVTGNTDAGARFDIEVRLDDPVLGALWFSRDELEVAT